MRERLAGGPAFLSFDIDVLDPAFAPGTGTPEVGGLLPHEALAFLRSLAGVEFVGYDVVEVSPQFDGPGQVTALSTPRRSGTSCSRSARWPRDEGEGMREPGQAPPITEVELHGIETIPPRTGRPRRSTCSG